MNQAHRCATLAAAAGLSVGLASDVLAQQVAADWLGGSGNWNDPTKWSTPLFPDNGNVPGQTYAVDIDITIGAIVELGQAVTVDSLDLHEGQLYIFGGDLTIEDTLSVSGTGNYRLRFGAIRGGVFDAGASGNGLRFSGTSNELDGLTINGNVVNSTSSSGATVRNGLTMNGTFSLAERFTSLRFDGDQMLTGNAVIGFDAGDPQDHTLVAVTDNSTLTIDSTVTLRGGSGQLYGTGNDSEPSSIINNGLISADVAGETINIRNAEFISSGTIEAINGGTLDIGGLGNEKMPWSSNGTIRAGAGSTLLLGGPFSLSGSTLDTAAGEVRIRGQLDNSGQMLALDATTGSWKLGGSSNSARSSINGGTVTTAPGESLQVVFSTFPNELVGVAFDGDLDVQGGILRIDGGSLSGTTTAAAGSSLEFDGAWSSDASINATDMPIVLGGTGTINSGFNLSRSGGSVTITGDVTNGAGVLELNAGTGDWAFQNGTLRSGTLRLNGANLDVEQGRTGLFDGVTLDGTMSITNPSAYLDIENGLTGGTIQITGVNSGVEFEGSQTLSGSEIVFDAFAGNARLAVNISSTLTIDPGSVVRGGLATIGGNRSGIPGGVIVNQGTIQADRATTTLTIGGSTLDNQGLLSAINGGHLSLTNHNGNVGSAQADGAGSRITIDGAYTIDQPLAFTNGSTLNLEGEWTNASTISVDSSTVELGGEFQTSDIGTIASTNGSVLVIGEMDNTGSLLTLDAGNLGFALSGGEIIGGEIATSAGNMLFASPGTTSELSGVTLSGDALIDNAVLNTEDLTLTGSASLQNGATMSLSGNWANNGSISVTDSTLNIGGTVDLANVGTINTSGASSVNLSGTITGTGQTLAISPTSLLTGISTGGELEIGTLELQGGIELPVVRGVIGANAITGDGTISVDGSTGSSAIWPDPNGASQTLTIGSGVTIEGFNVRLRNSPSGPGDITNDGTIRASEPGETIFLQSATFTNNGLIEVDGGIVEFVNGAFPQPDWTNNGTMRLNSGELVLGGVYTTADMGTLEHLGGTLDFEGDLDNSGSMLNLSSNGTVSISRDGRISGGTINVPAGQVLKTFDSGTLDGVSVNGDIEIFNADITNGFTQNGLTTIVGNVNVEGDQTIASGEFVISDSNFSVMGDSDVTLDPSVTIRGSGLVRQRFSSFGDGMLTNNGLISADEPGELLRIIHPNFSNGGTIEAINGATLEFTSHSPGWTNSGTIRAGAGSTIELGGDFRFLAGTNLENNGGSIRITGDLDNTGSTFSLMSGDAITLSGGSITGGVVDSPDSTPLVIDARSELNNVTVNTDIDLQDMGGFVRKTALFVENTLTLGGTMTVSGDDNIVIKGNATIDGGEILLTAHPDYREITADVPGTLTFGPSINVHGGSTHIGLTRSSPAGEELYTVINEGTIAADISGERIDIVPDVFDNVGRLEVRNGATLNVMGRTDDDTVSVLARTWSGTGAIRVEDGTLRLGGEFPVSAVSNLERTGGTVELAGVMHLQAGTLTLDGPGESWEFFDGQFVFGGFRGGRMLGGTVNLLNGADLITGSAPASKGVLDFMTVNGDMSIDGTLYARASTFNGNVSINGELILIPPPVDTLTGRGDVDPGPALLSGQRFILVDDGEQRGYISSDDLVIRPGVVVEGAGDIRRAGSGGDYLLVNQGRISANVPGNWLLIRPSGAFINEGVVEALDGSTIEIHPNGNFGDTWRNRGFLHADGGTIVLGGRFSVDDLGEFESDGGLFALDGFLEASESVLTLDGADGSWEVRDGSIIKGGTIRLLNGATLDFVGGSTTLDDVSIDGDIGLGDGAVIRAKGSLGLTGTASLHGSGATLEFFLDQTFSGGTIAFDGTSGGAERELRAIGSVATLTIDSDATVRGGGGRIVTGIYGGGQFATTVINLGLISADLNAQGIIIDSMRFQNLGTIEAINGGFVVFDPRGPRSGSFSFDNWGTLRVDGSGGLQIPGSLVQHDTSDLAFVLDSGSALRDLAPLRVDSLLADGDLVLQIAIGFEPRIGQRFLLFDAGSVQGAFDRLVLPELSGDLEWFTGNLYTHGRVSVVPAPATSLGALMTLALVAHRRRRP